MRFNRTTVECKQMTDEQIAELEESFNRTTVECK